MSSKSIQVDPFGSYYTPDNLADAIVERFVGRPSGERCRATEPGAGGGAFLRALYKRSWSCRVYEVDPFAPTFLGPDGVDFLTSSVQPSDVVVGNPAFHLAEDIIERSLLAAPRVVFLLPMKFLGGQDRHATKWHGDVADRFPLAHVSQIVGRVPFTRKVYLKDENGKYILDEDGHGVWSGEWTSKGSDSQEYGVFVFDVYHRGPWTGGWLEWK